MYRYTQPRELIAYTNKYTAAYTQHSNATDSEKDNEEACTVVGNGEQNTVEKCNHVFSWDTSNTFTDKNNGQARHEKKNSTNSILRIETGRREEAGKGSMDVWSRTVTGDTSWRSKGKHANQCGGSHNIRRSTMEKCRPSTCGKSHTIGMGAWGVQGAHRRSPSIRRPN